VRVATSNVSIDRATKQAGSEALRLYAFLVLGLHVLWLLELMTRVGGREREFLQPRSGRWWAQARLTPCLAGKAGSHTERIRMPRYPTYTQKFRSDGIAVVAQLSASVPDRRSCFSCCGSGAGELKAVEPVRVRDGRSQPVRVWCVPADDRSKSRSRDSRSAG